MKQIQRILAVTGAVLLIFMYLTTLILAVFDTGKGMVLFKACIMCTILLPILIWGYAVIYRLAKGRNEQELEETLQQPESKQPQKDQK